MARFPSDGRPRAPRAGAGRALLLALACLAPVAAAQAAATLTGDIVWEEGRNVRFNLRDRSWSMEEVKLRHDGSDTRMSATQADGIDRADGINEVNLSGKVHIEFRGAVLDAESAVMLFRGRELLDVQVGGSQAHFSHEFRPGRQITGNADAIAYDSATGKVRFSGNTFWTDGRHELNTDLVDYNINDGSAYSPTPSRGILRPDLDKERERIPTPRLPERSSAE